MSEPTDAELDAAQKRGRIATLTEPHAVSARYHAGIDRIVVELVNGCTFLLPPRIARSLETATDDELAEVEGDTVGFGLHRERLVADFTVAGLMTGRRGTARYMRDRFESHRDMLAAE